MADDRDATSTEATPDAADAPDDADLTRGQFLTKATLGVGAVLGGLITVPVAGMALTPAVAGRDFEPVKLVDDVGELPEGTYVKVVLEPGKDSNGAYVRKRVAFVRKNAVPAHDILAIKGQGDYTVVSNRCVHLGCPVQETGSGFVCPCHGGSYDDDGARTAGPPVRPLDRFEWELRDGKELWAVDEYSVRAVREDGKVVRGERVKVRGPGQHSGGPSGLLYPLQP